MSNQITMRDLEGAIKRLNRLAGTPDTYWTEKDGKRVINVGHYHLDGAYGGWKLVQTVTEGGGVRTPISMGYETKRECYNLIHAFISGFENGKGE